MGNCNGCGAPDTPVRETTANGRPVRNRRCDDCRRADASWLADVRNARAARQTGVVRAASSVVPALATTTAPTAPTDVAARGQAMDLLASLAVA